MAENLDEYKIDPLTALRMARNSAKARQAANIDKAIEEFYQAQDDFDRNFNPESYVMKRSGRGKISVPVGGRAGMINLHRPRYVADMNQSINADEDVLLNKDRLASANSLEAERNESMGWLKGSEQHRAQLEKSIGDYDREIAKLQAEIAMSEAGDPMYDLAVMRMIMNDDNSLMNDIRSRIGKKIDQEFQTKQKKADQEFQHNENELNRENTLEVAKLNKEEQKAAQKRDLENAFASAQQLYEFALGDLEANPNDPKLEREVEKAKELYRQAAVKADKMDDFNRRMGNSTDDDDKKPLWDEAAAAYGGLKGQKGIKEYIDSIKDPRLKAAVLRDLERSYYIDEVALGYSGAEAKINEDKAKAAAELEKKVKAAVKSYGKGEDGKKARDKAFDALSDSVKAKVVKGYKEGNYVIKRKGK